jgi:hypothetical protein
MKKLFQSDWVSRLIDALLPVFATLAALVLGAVMLLFLKVNPVEAYGALWDGAFGSSNAFAETLVKATPLLLVALGICISFRGDVINIGGEGQMIIGAILATWVGLTFTGLPGWLVITLAMLGGFLGGAIWGGIPGFLKAYFRVNEILSTVMMNAIAVQPARTVDRSFAGGAGFQDPADSAPVGHFSSASFSADPPAYGCVDRSGAGFSGLRIAVAHDAWLSYPCGGAKPSCLALRRDQGSTLHRSGAVVQWRVRGSGGSGPGLWCELSHLVHSRLRPLWRASGGSQ